MVARAWCSLYNLDGYNIAEKHRVNRADGGVTIYIQCHSLLSARPDIGWFDQDLETFFVKMDGNQADWKKNVILSVIYRPPNTSNEKLNEISNKIKWEDIICYLVGDFIYTGEFVDLMSS